MFFFFVVVEIIYFYLFNNFVTLKLYLIFSFVVLFYNLDYFLLREFKIIFTIWRSHHCNDIQTNFLQWKTFERKSILFGKFVVEDKEDNISKFSKFHKKRVWLSECMRANWFWICSLNSKVRSQSTYFKCFRPVLLL